MMKRPLLNVDLEHHPKFPMQLRYIHYNILRMEVLGLDDDYKRDLMGCDQKVFLNYKKEIEKSFQCKNWLLIVKKSFYLNILEPNEFVSSCILPVAEEFTGLIDDFLLKKNFLNQKKLLQTIILTKFIEKCRQELKQNKLKLFPEINKLEKDDIEYIEKLRLLSPKLYKGLKKSHKQTSFALEKLKMDTNNNFNLLRVAFAVGIFDESIFDRISTPLTISYAKKINEINQNRYEDGYRQLQIYNLLIGLFSDLEFKFVCSD